MKDIFSVIFMNFWCYDLIIFIAAVITAIVYYYLNLSSDKLYKKMHLTVFVPDGGASRKEADSDISELRETDIVTMRNQTGRQYSIFVNLTGIFPLLGILGTVISLLGLVADSTNVTGNFYGALTSTFWGLVFAIIFKFLDGIISAKIEDNEKSVALYLERNSSAARAPQPVYRRSSMPEREADITYEQSERTESEAADSSSSENKRNKSDDYSVYELLNSLSSGDEKL